MRPGRGITKVAAAALAGALLLVLPNGTARAGPPAPTGPMLVLNQGTGTITGYPAGAHGDLAPTSLLSLAGGSNPYQMVFDPSGNVWVIEGGTNTLVEYASAQLADGSPTPHVTISSSGSSSLTNPMSLVFDGAGDAWVLNCGNATVVEFTAAQLAQSGSPTPVVTLSNNGTTFSGDYSLTMDAAGDLWTADYGTDAVIEFLPSQIAASGAPAAHVTLSATGSSLVGPTGLTFDLGGDLWVANTDNSTVVEFPPADLAASGTPTPAVTLHDDGSGSISAPHNLGIDRAGDLWVASTGTNAASGYTPAQLVTGAPVPAEELRGVDTELGSPVSILFPPPAGTAGYRFVAGDGGIFAYGDAGFYGSTGSIRISQPMVGMAATPDDLGYWEVAADGGIFAYGDAQFYGSTGSIHLQRPVVGMAATPDGKGYWLVASDGGIFAYGNATFYGSTGSLTLNRPVVGMAATPDGRGYWLVASDGGIFDYGNAGFYGSTGSLTLNRPVVGMAATADGRGYWLVASDGGIFAYGDATFYGSTGSISLREPMVGMAATPDGRGYWLVAADGGIFAYGDAPFLGSMGSANIGEAIVGIEGD